MTTTTYVVFVCDEPACPVEYLVTGVSIQTAERNARAEGWSCGHSTVPFLHYCPEHARHRGRPKGWRKVAHI